MRETYIDEHGTERFKPNKVVEYILLRGTRDGADMNTLWIMYNTGFFTLEEMKEFYQLINYSISGYEEIFSEVE